MDMRHFQDRVAVSDGNLFFTFRTDVYESDTYIAGYYSTVGRTDTHILTADIDVTRRNRWDKTMFRSLSREVADLMDCPDVVILRTAHGYHALTTGIYAPIDMIHWYSSWSRLLGDDRFCLDGRHLAAGLLRKPPHWTLRFSPKPKLRGDRVTLFGYEIFPSCTRPWSESHHGLLSAIVGKRLPRPTGNPRKEKVGLVVYRE